MEVIRLGLVGSGGMAAKRAASFAALKGFRLIALAARNQGTGAELARRHGLELLGNWEELVQRPDVDAVAVCTPNDSHGPIARAALEAGKHVFLEYPLARRLEEGEELVRTARSTGRVLRVAHGEVAHPGHRQLKETVRAMGGLLVALFARLTPGRGARPEVLFNIPVSGPPALFFVYHIYPLVDLFGPAAWVEGYTHYEGSGRQLAPTSASSTGRRWGLPAVAAPSGPGPAALPSTGPSSTSAWCWRGAPWCTRREAGSAPARRGWFLCPRWGKKVPPWKACSGRKCAVPGMAGAPIWIRPWKPSASAWARRRRRRREGAWTCKKGRRHLRFRRPAESQF